MSRLAEAYHEDKYCVECEAHHIDCVCEGTQCLECYGKGELVNCLDDLCHAQGECMHEGNDLCPECSGEDVVYPPRKPDYRGHSGVNR